MGRRFPLPPLAIAAALLGLIAVLATLQYRWLGRISDAERERMRATVSARAAAFAEDFDRELALAYMLFQVEPFAEAMAPGLERLPERLAARYERWQATSRHPRLFKEIYVNAATDAGAPRLFRFDSAARTVAPADWPAPLARIRAGIEKAAQDSIDRQGILVRTVVPALWDDIPAVVVPMPPPLRLLDGRGSRGDPHGGHLLSYTILVLDLDYVTSELLPALARAHFRGVRDEVGYQLAVVSASGAGPLYRSTPEFSPEPDARADATAELFRMRPQEFGQLAADVRRFLQVAPPPSGGGAAASRDGETVRRFFELPFLGRAAADGPVSVFVDKTDAGRARTRLATVTGAAAAGGGSARWRLLVKHPSGSLEAAVSVARRRNLLVSTSILGILAASLVLIVVSTRRSQELARRQMEFVAAVSHELRTPLAVIRSAGENLADGVVRAPDQIQRYGTLVSHEGRRLTEMVEQILEFSGIHFGQRTLQAVAVTLDGVIDAVLRDSEPLIAAAGLRIDVDVPAGLPPVAGDGAALRRVFQNLVGNAIKYGAAGGSVGISARRVGAEVAVSVRDKGMGIAPADQTRIFEPFYRAPEVVAAQIQGAGLGLSLVLRIVQAHGGRVSVKSARGSGSEFTVHLPITTEARAGRSAEAGEDLIAPGAAARARDAT